jgi:hypothetical protein
MKSRMRLGKAKTARHRRAAMFFLQGFRFVATRPTTLNPDKHTPAKVYMLGVRFL